MEVHHLWKRYHHPLSPNMPCAGCDHNTIWNRIWFFPGDIGEAWQQIEREWTILVRGPLIGTGWSPCKGKGLENSWDLLLHYAWCATCRIESKTTQLSTNCIAQLQAAFDRHGYLFWQHGPCARASSACCLLNSGIWLYEVWADMRSLSSAVGVPICLQESTTFSISWK